MNRPTHPDESPVGRRGVRLASAALAATLLAACGGGTLPTQLANVIKPVVPAPAPAPAPPPPAPPPSAPPPASTVETRGRADARPAASEPAPTSDGAMASRPFQGLQQLFAKGTVDGSELLSELTAVRNLFRTQRSGNVVAAMAGGGSPTSAPSAAGAPANLQALGAEAANLLARRAVDKLEAEVKPYLASIGVGAIDTHLTAMIEDPRLLRAERIKLPSPQGLTHAQLQRIVNMAAMLAATRVTGKVLAKAKLDFANVENDYLRLIERRERAAQVLYDLLIKQAATPNAPELAGLFTEADTKYLNENVRKMSVRDFGNDLGAQNLALRYLRRTDPAAWAEYKSRSDGLMSSTKGYIRSAAGVTAFAALLANFTNETVGQAKKMKPSEIAVALPFAAEFVLEAPPVLKAAYDVGAAGIIELPSKALRRFRIENASGREDVRAVADVFAAMRKQQVEALFNEALFRADAEGLVYRVFSCDRSEAGRMIDLAVPVAEREKFALAYFGSAQSRFSFQNAFAPQAQAARERELGDQLLRADHRVRTTVVAFGDVQRLATQGATRWNNDQLMRLILANREGTAAHATLQLGEVRIRPVPSMQSVYAYESLVDECAKQFGESPK